MSSAQPGPVTPEQALTLIEDEGYTYIDVRSEPEFAAAHPRGAKNVPLLHAAGGRLTPNPEFVEVMKRVFATDAKLVVACQAGKRSAQAVQVLRREGFTHIVDMPAGFGGGRDASGRLEKGWQAAGLPVDTGQDEGSYPTLRLEPVQD